MCQMSSLIEDNAILTCSKLIGLFNIIAPHYERSSSGFPASASAPREPITKKRVALIQACDHPPFRSLPLQHYRPRGPKP